MIELALEVARDIVPFQKGDTVGKGDDARMHALEQLAHMEPGSARAKLFELQALGAELPEVEMPLQHVFAPGCYARTIFIPAGTFVVGKIHKHQHINVLSQGDVSVFTEGAGVEHLRGPLTMSSAPGTKRALLAHTDVTWTTIHVTDLTDLDEIEDYVIAKTYEDYEQFALAQQQRIEVNHATDL
jgi:hypothetical protein